MYRIVTGSAGTPLNFVVEREAEPITDRRRPRPGLRGETPSSGVIGSDTSASGPRPARRRGSSRYGPVAALDSGCKETAFVVERTFSYLGKLVTGRESADQLSGPIGIARVSGEVAKIGGVGGLVGLIALLSVSIGLLNLFPVPLLDGGHLLFYAFEVVRGRPLSERAQEIGFRLGLALVLDADDLRGLERHPQPRRVLAEHLIRSGSRAGAGDPTSVPVLHRKGCPIPAAIPPAERPLGDAAVTPISVKTR